MGLHATVRLIDQDSFQSVADGDLSGFDTCEDDNTLKLDKLWHAVSYVLTGNNELVFIKNGIQLPEVSETAEVLSPQQTKKVNKLFRDINLEEIESKYSPDEFDRKNIYPGNCQRFEFAHIEPYIKNTLKYINYAATNNYGLFTTII